MKAFFCVILLVVLVEGLIITSPPEFAGYIESAPGGVPGPTTPFTAQVYLASPSDCCNPIQNAIAGGVAICYRGICSYVLKYQMAYAANASAVIMVNTNNRLLQIQRDLRFKATAPIPGTLVKKSDGDRLSKAVENGTKIYAQIMQAPMDQTQKAALIEIATANKFTWKAELTLAPVDTATSDPCRVPWTITNAAIGSALCDEYGNAFFITFASAGLTTIPDSAASFTHAHTVIITGNSALTVYPEKVFSQWKNLFDITLTGNGFEGPLPDLSRWINCRYMDLSANGFSGPLPNSIGSLSLELLSLASNELTGTIPVTISNMPKLTTLDLSYNNFEGTMSDFVSPVLTSVDFSGNKFSGNAPTFAASTGITSLVLQDNNFEGYFNIGNLTRLQVLKIGRNKFTDIGSLKTFTTLQTLDISYNLFSDPAIISSKLPVSLLLLFASHNKFTKIPPMLTLLEMQTLDLSYNEIEQDWRDIIVNVLPAPDAAHLSQLKGLGVLLLSHNKIFHAASSGEMRVCTYAPLLISVDLSYNRLNTSFEDAFPTTCTFLTQMDFSNNLIIGSVPATLTRVTSLEVMDLRNNSMHSPGKELDGDLYTYNYKELTLNLTGSYSCPTYSFSSTGTVLLLDPDYFDYAACTCQPGFRHIPFNDSTPDYMPCKECPDHVNCPGIFNDNVTIVAPGYYPIPSFEDPIMAIPCLSAANCNPDGAQNYQCAEGSSKRLCSYCDEGYYKNGNLCEKCSPTGIVLIVAAVILFTGVIAIKFFIDIRMYMSGHKTQEMNVLSPPFSKRSVTTASVSDTSSTSSGSSVPLSTSNLLLSKSSPGLSIAHPWYHTRSTIAIAINYYQTLTIVTKHSTMPSLVSSILEVFKLSNITKGGVGLECIGSFFRPIGTTYAIIIMQPLFVLLGVLVIYFAGKGIIYLLKQAQAEQLKLANEYWFIICIHVVLFFLDFMFMPLSTYILSIFPCTRDPITNVNYLSIEPHYECYTIPVAGKIIPLLVDMIALYMLFCALLFWYQKSKGNSRFILLHSFGFFFAHFKPSWTWMSIFILTRRLLHAIAMGFTASDTNFLPAVNLIIIATSLMVTTTAKPYKQLLDNISENVSQIVLIVVYIIAFMMSNFDGGELVSVFYLINFGITVWFIAMLVLSYQEYWRRFLPQSKVHVKPPTVVRRISTSSASSVSSFADEN